MPILIGDERRFKQVLINLVKNALKFTFEGSIEVTVRYNKAKKVLIAQVADTGCGIAREDIHRLFTRFGKLQRTAEINSTGIGLGLTIVKQIVEQSGGEIEVKSDGVDLGSQFLFSMNLDYIGPDEQVLSD